MNDETNEYGDSSDDERQGWTSDGNEGYPQKRQRLTKSQMIYGVFGEAEEPSRFKSSMAAKEDVPVMFVAASSGQEKVSTMSRKAESQNTRPGGLQNSSASGFRQANSPTERVKSTQDVERTNFVPSSQSPSIEVNKGGIGFVVSSTATSSNEGANRGGIGFVASSSAASSNEGVHRGGIGFVASSTASSNEGSNGGGIGFVVSSNATSSNEGAGIGFVASSTTTSSNEGAHRGGIGFVASSTPSSNEGSNGGGIGFVASSTSSSNEGSNGGGIGFVASSTASNMLHKMTANDPTSDVNPSFADRSTLKPDMKMSLQDSASAAGRTAEITFERLAQGSDAPTEKAIRTQIENEALPTPKTTYRKRKGKQNSKKLSDWEMSSSGIGRKLLEKYGYTGGALGGTQKGITKPIEVQVRPTGLGIGFGGFKEQVHLNKDVHKEAFGHHKDGSEEEDELPTKESQSSDYINMWKKFGGDHAEHKGRRGRKPQVRSTQEFVQNLKANEKNNLGSGERVVIVDHRSRKPRILTNLHKLTKQHGSSDSSSSDESDGSSDGSSSSDSESEPDTSRDNSSRHLLKRRRPRKHLAREVSHNLGALVSICESRIASAESKRSAALNRIKELKEEREDLNIVMNTESTQMRTLSAIVKDIEEIHTKKASLQNLGGISSILTSVSELRTKYPNEYVEYSLDRIVGALVAPLMKLWAKKEWKEALFPPLDGGVLVGSSEVAASGITEQVARFRDALKLTFPTSNQSPHSLFNHIMESALLPEVVVVLSKNWQVHQPEVGLRVVEQVEPFLARDRFRDLLRQTVLPKLTRAVSTWTIESDHRPDLWLFPWLPKLGESMYNLYPSIRNKMERWAMKPQWVPVGQTGQRSRAMLSPWVGHWSRASMGRLVERCVIPKLISQLEGIEINPADQQNMDVVQSLVEWRRILTSEQLSCLLVGELMPKWLDVLTAWVNSCLNSGSKGGLKDVFGWYRGWKALVPEEVLSLSPIFHCFLMGLRVIKHGLDGKPTEALSLKELNYSAMASHMPRKVDQRGAPPPTPRGRNFDDETFSVSLKDAVEAFAIRAGVAFTLHTKRRYQGKPVYKFGKFNLLFEKEAVLMEAKTASGSSNEWVHVTSFNDLASQSLQ